MDTSTDCGPPLVARRRVHRAWWVATGAFCAIAAAGAYATVAGLLIEPLNREFGWSRAAIGVAVSVNMVLYGLTAPFAAAVTERFGLRRVLAAALAALAAGAGLTTIVTAPWQLVLTWGVFVGLGTGSLSSTFAATVTERWFAARRGLVSGLLTSAGVLGQFAFLPLLAGIVDSAGWRTTMVILGLAAVVVAPAAWLLVRDRPADSAAHAYGATGTDLGPVADPGGAGRAVRVLGSAARTRPFWLLALMFAICGASTNGVMWTHFVPAAHHHGMPTTVAASLLTIIGVCNLAGTIGSGWLTDRADPRWLLAGFFALRAATLLALPLLLGPTVRLPLVAFAVAFGILDLATVPPIIALCQRLYGGSGAIVFGWVNGAHQIGAALAATLGGITRDATGSYDPVWIAVGLLCLIAAATARRSPVRSRARGTDRRPLDEPDATIRTQGSRCPAA
jgi:predicted MFS family arabinose efflux permease